MTIRLGRNHWAGVIVGTVFISFVVSFMIRNFFNNDNLAMLIAFLLLIGPCYMSLRSRYRSHYSKFPIVLCARVGSISSGTQVCFADIQSIEVRENTGRDHVEDSALSQIYLRLGNDSRLLIYQHYLCYKDRVRQLAKQVSDVVGVPLVDNF